MASPALSTAWVPLWPLATPLPAVQNGKWLKGAGGAMVWSDVVALGGGNASAANTDLVAPTAPVYEFQVTSGGGSVRSIGSWPSPGSARVIVHNWVGSTPFTLIAGAGGLPGGQTALSLKDNANLVLGLGESVEFVWDGSWREVARNLKLSYGTTLPTSPYDGQEAILVDSVTNPAWQWQFRYNASSSSAYKWEFFGGIPCVANPTGFTQGQVAAHGWLGIGGGPSFWFPRNGEYLVEWGITLSSNDGVQAVYGITARMAVAAVLFSALAQLYIPGGGQSTSVASSYLFTGVASGQNLYHQALAGQAGQINTGPGWFVVTPRRVA